MITDPGSLTARTLMTENGQTDSVLQPPLVLADVSVMASTPMSDQIDVVCTSGVDVLEERTRGADALKKRTHDDDALDDRICGAHALDVRTLLASVTVRKMMADPESWTMHGGVRPRALTTHYRVSMRTLIAHSPQ